MDRTSLTIIGTDMRFVVYGAGAVGGTVAAALASTGQDVTAIARGAQLEALREGGLRLRTPSRDETIRFPVVASPAEAEIGPDDAVLLCMKGQDTQAALEALRAVGMTNQPIFCLQNGVANERKALRLFPNVHGVTVMLPCAFTRPGEVAVYSEPNLGVFDVGLAAGGHDSADAAFAEAMSTAGLTTHLRENVMASKYGKLLRNLENITEAAFGAGAELDDLVERMFDEAYAAFTAAGVGWEEISLSDERRAPYMRFAEVPDLPRGGSSTSQSLERGTGSIETDWLNGEIVLLGRLHGIATPVNTALTVLAARMAREGAMPGSASLQGLIGSL